MSLIKLITSTSLCILLTLEDVKVNAIPIFEGELYEDLINDPRAQVETVYTSLSGIITARASSLVSSISSFLIIVIIMRSVTKLSTVYHRIVFGMSVSDCLGSLAIALATWPMPKEMIYRQFDTAVYGNSTTCTVQGFFFLTGMIATFSYNTSLCIYYLCVMRFQRTEKSIRKRIEPFLHVLSLCIPLGLTVPLIYLDLIVPTPYDFTCTGATYPYWCGGGTEQDPECLQLSTTKATQIRLALLAAYFLGAFIIFSSMINIAWTVFSKNRKFSQYLETMYSIRMNNKSEDINRDTASNPMVEQRRVWHAESKIILLQASSYLAAFLVCQIFPLISLLVRKNSSVLQFTHVLLRPLQGFFNFLIFIGIKMYNRRRSNSDISRYEAFLSLFISPDEEHEPSLFLSNMNIVMNHNPHESETSVPDIRYSEPPKENNQKVEDVPASSTGISFGMSHQSSPPRSFADGAGLSHDSTRNDLGGEDKEKSEDIFSEDVLSNGSGGVISWFSRSFQSHDISRDVSSTGIIDNHAGGISWFSRSFQSHDISRDVSSAGVIDKTH